MIKNKKVLAIIPARAGSKRLKNKNILELNGKPLIGWTIDAALNSQYVDDIFVSTDDESIAEYAINCGVLVPELRPEYLASDNATTESVIRYILDKYRNMADIIILLQPTSPLRTQEHINAALELFLNKKATSVVSVCKSEHSPLWANTLPNDFSMNNFITVESKKRSQDLDTFYRLNGAIYIYDIDLILGTNSLEYNETTFAYLMDSVSSIDIDTQSDFEYATFCLKKKVK